MSYHSQCWKKYQRESEEYRTNFQSNGLFGDSNDKRIDNTQSTSNNYNYKPPGANKKQQQQFKPIEPRTEIIEGIADVIVDYIRIFKEIFRI